MTLRYEGATYAEEVSLQSTSTFEVVRETWFSRAPHVLAMPVTFAITLAIFAVNVWYWQGMAGAHLMRANGELVFQNHEYWRLWTTLLIHGDQKHLLSNSFLFLILGWALAGYFSWIAFPIMAFLFGGLINWIVLVGMPPTTGLIGLSGVVFWLGGAWLTLYFLLDRKRRLGQRTLRALGVGIMLFLPSEAFDPSISYKSHLLGFILGVVWAGVFYLIRRKQFLAALVTETITEPSEDITHSPDANFRTIE